MICYGFRSKAKICKGLADHGAAAGTKSCNIQGTPKVAPATTEVNWILVVCPEQMERFTGLTDKSGIGNTVTA
jgi:hypothetical protein